MVRISAVSGSGLVDRRPRGRAVFLPARSDGVFFTAHRRPERIPPYRETRDYVRKVGSAAGDSPISTRKLRIYKTIEIVDGRVVPRYSSEKPSSGSFEIISR